MKIYINDLVKGHSDFKVKCLTFGLYTQVSDSGPLGPLVYLDDYVFTYRAFKHLRLSNVLNSQEYSDSCVLVARLIYSFIVSCRCLVMVASFSIFFLIIIVYYSERNS